MQQVLRVDLTHWVLPSDTVTWGLHLQHCPPNVIVNFNTLLLGLCQVKKQVREVSSLSTAPSSNQHDDNSYWAWGTNIAAEAVAYGAGLLTATAVVANDGLSL